MPAGVLGVHHQSAKETEPFCSTWEASHYRSSKSAESRAAIITSTRQLPFVQHVQQTSPGPLDVVKARGIRGRVGQDLLVGSTVGVTLPAEARSHSEDLAAAATLIDASPRPPR